ncbi:MAG TPA: sterol desaturase family protein [Capsulimonadaceae bacterium]|jgi:hypothetical protein
MSQPSIWVWEAIGFVGIFLYASFFEWWFHKYMFHSPKIVKRTFVHHTLIHHQVYKYEPQSYEWNPPREKDHITMDWWALPLFLLVHAPLLIGMQWLTGKPVAIGGFAAIAVYYGVYEYFHYAMHVPGPQWFQRSKLFLFVKEHHRVHHKYMLHNLNVFFPLADMVLGTYRTEFTQPRVDRNKGANRAKAAERIEARRRKVAAG